MLIISPAVRSKLSRRHQVSDSEIEEAFTNRQGGFLEDQRADNATIPPTLWFIAQTHHGRLLKVVFIIDGQNIIIKTAYEPNPEEIRIYRKYGGIHES